MAVAYRGKRCCPAPPPRLFTLLFLGVSNLILSHSRSQTRENMAKAFALSGPWAAGRGGTSSSSSHCSSIPAFASQCACAVRECAWTPFLCARQGAAARDADLARGELAQMTIQAGMAPGLLAKAQADVTQLAVHVVLYQSHVEMCLFTHEVTPRAPTRQKTLRSRLLL
jgi:hypothetical protein